MAKCLFCTIRPLCPRITSGSLDAPFTRFAPPALNNFRHPSYDTLAQASIAETLEPMQQLCEFYYWNKLKQLHWILASGRMEPIFYLQPFWVDTTGPNWPPVNVTFNTIKML